MSYVQKDDTVVDSWQDCIVFQRVASSNAAVELTYSYAGLPENFKYIVKLCLFQVNNFFLG
jgi:hypothetical protein